MTTREIALEICTAAGLSSEMAERAIKLAAAEAGVDVDAQQPKVVEPIIRTVIRGALNALPASHKDWLRKQKEARN